MEESPIPSLVRDIMGHEDLKDHDGAVQPGVGRMKAIIDSRMLQNLM